MKYQGLPSGFVTPLELPSGCAVPDLQSKFGRRIKEGCTSKNMLAPLTGAVQRRQIVEERNDE
jgi:hypothetical protein